jgi:hypothetical protein
MGQEQYDAIHADFCRWFSTNIRGTARKHKSGRIIPGYLSSWGQAAKVLDVAAKVYVYYCAQPSLGTAERLTPFLHAALDTDMMQELWDESPESIKLVQKDDYNHLQLLVLQRISGTPLHRVQYDDVMWRNTQRRDPV